MRVVIPVLLSWGEQPRLWGSVTGFGQYHYKYNSGREGDAPAAGFSPRKAATSIYLLDGIGRYGDQLSQLGPHTTGVGCLYIKDLHKIDISVLEGIVTESYRTLTVDTYGLRAREGVRRRLMSGVWVSNAVAMMCL